MSLNVTYETVVYRNRAFGLHFRDSTETVVPLRARPHLHRDLELIIYLDGETVAYADSQRCVLQPGDVFLTFPNQIHAYESPLRPEKYLLFIVKPELLPEFAELFQSGVPASPIVHGLANDPELLSLAGILRKYGRGKEAPLFDAARCRGYLLAMFSMILSRMEIREPSTGDSDALRAIISYCSDHFQENLSLSVLQEELHLNKYYISHLFSGKLGLRFNDYINSLRVSGACRYLLNSTHSVTEISEIVGFNTLRTFNRAFQKQLGVSPTEYRKISAPGR